MGCRIRCCKRPLFKEWECFYPKLEEALSFFLYLFSDTFFLQWKNIYILVACAGSAEYWWLVLAQNIGGLCWLCISISINISVHTLSFSIKRLILFYIIIFHKKPVLTSCMYLFLIFFSKSFLLCLYPKDFLFEFKIFSQIICSQ